MRDDFSPSTKETIARRVNYLCSSPDCRQQTSGPQVDPAKAVNVGVAAHITAASPTGPRYDSSLTPDERCSAENGIWLCQNHGKLVDNDPIRFTVAMLRDWKHSAEDSARTALECPRIELHERRVFEKAERHMPELLREMRSDLREHPLFREFVVLKKTWSYNHEGLFFAFYYEDHSELDDKLRLLENLGLIRNVTATNVDRFRLTENFVDYLEAASSRGVG